MVRYIRFLVMNLNSEVSLVSSPKVGEEGSGSDYYRVLEGLGQSVPSQAANPGGIEARLPTTPHVLFQGNNHKVEQEREKSLNQNVFGKKFLVLPKPSEGLVYDEEAFSTDVFQGEEGTLQVVQGFKSSEDLSEEVRGKILSKISLLF